MNYISILIRALLDIENIATLLDKLSTVQIFYIR